jgi:methionyl-tRNA formyltransferase
MRVLFAGTPAIAVPSLEILEREEGITLAGVLTNPDKPRGRKGESQPSEVCETAQEILRLYKEEGRDTFPILKPLKLDAALREEVDNLKPDLLVSFAYGHFFGPKFMALFPLGGINIHPSLLPKYRGPAPLQAAIINRDSETGISIQKLAQEIDSGDILAVEHLQLTGVETAESLGEVISQKAAQILPSVLEKIAKGERGTAQDHSKASFCSMISRDDALIDWEKQSAAEIEARIRAFTPWPLCRTIHNGRELFILKAVVYNGEKSDQGVPGQVLGIDKNGILIQTGSGILAVTELQYQAKKALFWRDFLNGARYFTGSKLG